MDQNYVDKYIKDQLSSHETEIDNDLLWAAIEQRQKKGKTPFWSTIALFIAVMLVSLLAWNMYNKSGDTNHTKTLSESYNYTPATTGQEAKEINSNQSSIDKNTAINLKSETENQSDFNSLNDNKNQKTQYTYNQSNTEEQNQGAHFKTTKKSSDNNYSTTNKRKEENLKNKFNKNQKAFQEASQSNQLQQALQDNLNQNNTQHVAFTSASDQSGNQTADINNKAKDNSLSAIQNRLIMSVQSIDNKTSLLDNVYALPVPKLTDCPTFGSKKRNIYLMGYAFLDYVKSPYSTSGDITSYFARREQTLSNKPSYRLGIQAKYVFDNGIYIRGGVELGQVREGFKDRIVDTLVEIRPDQLISFYETSPGDTTFIYGNAPVTTISAKNWNVKNTYTSIDIPLLIGYQIKKSGLTYGLELGIMQNLKFSTKAFYLDDTNTPRYVDDYYLDKINLSLTGGLSVGYALRPDWSILGFCHFKQNLSDINSAINPINQRHLSIGLGLGIQYRL